MNIVQYGFLDIVQHGNMKVTQQKMSPNIDFAIQRFWGNYLNILGWHFHHDDDNEDGIHSTKSNLVKIFEAFAT